jgi:hypothetical protein
MSTGSSAAGPPPWHRDAQALAPEDDSCGASAVLAWSCPLLRPLDFGLSRPASDHRRRAPSPRQAQARRQTTGLNRHGHRQLGGRTDDLTGLRTGTLPSVAKKNGLEMKKRLNTRFMSASVSALLIETIGRRAPNFGEPGRWARLRPIDLARRQLQAVGRTPDELADLSSGWLPVVGNPRFSCVKGRRRKPGLTMRDVMTAGPPWRRPCRRVPGPGRTG